MSVQTKTYSFLQLFSQSYSPPNYGWKGLFTSVLFGAFIGGFLLFFKPFNLNVGPYSDLNILFFGFITASVFAAFQLIFPRLFPAFFSEKNWKVYHQIGFYLLILFCIATLNGMYINHVDKLSFNWPNYGWIISRTIALGSFPIAFYVLIDHNRKLNQFVSAAQDLQPLVGGAKKAQSSRTFYILTQLKEETFTIEEATFLFAEASGNYVYIHEKGGKKNIRRLTLNSLKDQLPSPTLIRCHRSYLVNLQKVKSVSGNAQGLSLSLKENETTIPVSRKYVSSVRAHFQDLRN
ncbi:MAG: LytTR family DNA-binding domain-containing protein [Bacteroidota bacterium]